MASSEGGDVPTPFYDLLTSIIQAHALENACVRQNNNATDRDDMIPPIVSEWAASLDHRTSSALNLPRILSVRGKVLDSLCGDRWGDSSVISVCSHHIGDHDLFNAGLL